MAAMPKPPISVSPAWQKYWSFSQASGAKSGGGGAYTDVGATGSWVSAWSFSEGVGLRVEVETPGAGAGSLEGGGCGARQAGHRSAPGVSSSRATSATQAAQDRRQRRQQSRCECPEVPRQRRQQGSSHTAHFSRQPRQRVL